MTDTTTVPVPASPAPQRELAPMEALRQTLIRMESEFRAALPPQIPVDKFLRTTVTAIQMQPALLEADRRSLLGACMKAAQDGLLLDGREAAAVIFGGKGGARVQYMPMLGGLLKKLRNSGELASIAAHVVYDTDQFTYELGDNESITHKPSLGSSRGKPIAAYAIARTKDGAIYREVMSLYDIEKVRNVSRAKDSGPWTQWWDEMAKKTVIRRLCKRLPSSADVDALLDRDNEGYDLENRPQAQAQATEPAQPVAQLSRLKAAIELVPEEVKEVEDVAGQPTPDA